MDVILRTLIRGLGSQIISATLAASDLSDRENNAAILASIHMRLIAGENFELIAPTFIMMQDDTTRII